MGRATIGKTTKERATVMEWENTGAVWHRTKAYTARAHRYYYVFEMAPNKWIAGRFSFGKEFDYRNKTFKTAKAAREYCEKQDREAVVIEAITA